MATRQEILESIRKHPYVSVLVIGGGINGIGTFRDLAQQGLDVILVEMDDFCSGASAASSHMVHGGLRYLENGEFRLVKEALTERNRLLQNAPHQVRPLPTTIPIFTWFSGMLNAPLKFLGLMDKPSPRGTIVIKLGLTMYDWFTKGQQTLPAHRVFSRDQSLARRPELNPEIVSTATYYDAWMPYPERICVELILDAEADSTNARALNYTKVVGAAGDTVMLRDELTGETFEIRPKVVVNAAGPWIDFTNAALNRSTRFIGGTKGSHLLLDHPQLHETLQGQEIFFENVDGRITLIFPLKERVIIGTTDIRTDDPDGAVCTPEEIDYMLQMIPVVFPNIHVDKSHIVFGFSGVRPLPRSDASTTGQISRDHSIQVTAPGQGISFPVYSLIGGKWTTFRAFAEQTADAVLAFLNQKRRARTVDTPIGGGKDYPRQDTQRWLTEKQLETGLSRDRLETLFDRYGTRLLDLVAYVGAGEDAPLHTRPDYTTGEIRYLTEIEKVVHLDDLLLRRSLIAMLGYADGELLKEVAGIMGQVLGWTPEQQRQEVARSAQILIEKHNMQPDKFATLQTAAL